MSEKSSKDNDFKVVQEWTPLQLAEMKTGRGLGQIRRARGVSGRKRFAVKGQSACYHVMSRTVNGEFLFGRLEKEAFRRMMWRMARFAGVEILTYAMMDNHFHILLKVPEQKKWLKRFDGKNVQEQGGREGEEKLLEHLSIVYSKAYLAQLRREIFELRKQGYEKEIQELLQRYKDRFCDLSLFVKELKERFSRWYNKQHSRRGTLWMDRFKSVVVESGEALETMAAYIDLNPVRAKLVKDPKDYEWSGYGEAVRGSRRARRGLCKVVEVAQDAWGKRGAPAYRCWLYHDGIERLETRLVGRENGERKLKTVVKKEGIATTEVEAVKKREGRLTRREMLGVRVRAFTTGVAVGSEDFVKGISLLYQEKFKRTKSRRGKQLESKSGGLYLMKDGW